MRRALIVVAVFASTAGFCGGGRLGAAEKGQGPKRWEPAIARFEAHDREHPPAPGGVMFLGSSSIRMWDLDKWFPELDAVNRGFGGSQIEDSLFFAERIVMPHKPRAIVFYAGDNDIAAGKSPEKVFADYQTFVARIHKDLPETKIVYVAIKPSIRRWNLVGSMREANRMIEEFSSKEELLEYVDVDSPMIGDDGRPREELFLQDGLHLSDEGYRIWTELVMPHLKP